LRLFSAALAATGSEIERGALPLPSERVGGFVANVSSRISEEIVDRRRDRGVTGSFCTLQQFAHDAAIGLHIMLEPFRAGLFAAISSMLRFAWVDVSISVPTACAALAVPASLVTCASP